MAFRAIWVAAWLTLGLATPAPASQLHLQLRVIDPPRLEEAEDQGSTADLSTAPVTVQVAPLHDAEAEPLSRELTELPTRAIFDVPPGWVEISVESPDYWADEEIVEVLPEGRAVTLALHLLGEVRGLLKPPADAPPPEDLNARLRPVPGTEGIELPVFPCVLTDDSSFRCPVPAGTWDLTLRAPGFISHRFWNLTVPPHAERSVSPLALRAGASVVGWILPPAAGSGEGFDFADTRVRLRPRGLGIADAADRHRRGVLTLESLVNDRGFFELAGVEAGSHELRITHPGFATTLVAPVEVFEGAETEITALELARPAAVTVQLEPPRDPRGQPWTVELLRQGMVPGHLDTVAEGVAGEDGVFTADGLEPGTFRLGVEDGAGAGWAYESFELGPGEDAFHPLALPAEHWRGRVLLGDEELAGARVHLGGRHGAQRVSVTTDDDGVFEVWLPERDAWSADVDHPAEAISSHFPALDPRPDGPSFTVELAIPDTRLRGRVVDSRGRPVPGATVQVGGANSPLETIPTDGSEGKFQVRGREAGTWNLQAFGSSGTGHLASEVYTVDVRESFEPPEVELVVRPMRSVAGQVVNDAGAGIPGAMVLVLPEQEGLGMTLSFRPLYTDVDGVFRTELPAAASVVRVTVFPPGQAVAQVRHSLEGSTPLLVPVDRLGGTVRLRHSSRTEGDEPPPRWMDIQLFHESWLGPTHYLRQWSEAHGLGVTEPEAGVPELTLPGLAPGPYTACLISMVEALSGFVPQGETAPCVRGELAPYGELVLEVGG